MIRDHGPGLTPAERAAFHEITRRVGPLRPARRDWAKTGVWAAVAGVTLAGWACILYLAWTILGGGR